jgi:type II restriction/modification system DNA methylase subunit YeeA
VRVLDPACGSGNFLYLAILALKDLEHKVNLDVETLGLGRQFPSIGPECVKGIEINPYAAELARVTVWIGEIQWMRRNGFDVERKPILRPLDTIECRDAVLNPDGSEAEWPAAEFIIGNPPFLGGSLILGAYGEEYQSRLWAAYKGRIPGGANLVCYWFEKARALIVRGEAKSTGLVATNSIRSGANRAVLERIVEAGRIFEAWSDEPWTVEGAAVRVSLVCFEGQGGTNMPTLDGVSVLNIHPTLTADIDLTNVPVLQQNTNICFEGTKKYGAFDIPGECAREWLKLPLNPNKKSNSDVVKPWANGMDITRRPSDTWIIDFGCERTEMEASLYEAPFKHVVEKVKPYRQTVRRERTRKFWWRHEECRPGMRRALVGMSRYIVTPRVSKYRLFVWTPPQVLPDTRLVVVARDDDTTFGILHSKFHELWSLRLGGWHGVGNDPQYTPSAGFETFPFPQGLTPDIPAEQYADDPRAQKIATAAKRLDELRNNWLNPPDLIMSVPEVVKGYPDRILPKDEAAAQALKTRTLTNLYNERPAWLDNAHRDLDEAVANAYGWPSDMPDDEILMKLLALNLEKAKD